MEFLKAPAFLRKLFVGNLSPEITEDSLRQHFEQFGKITDMVIMLDLSTHRSSYSFVTFVSSCTIDQILSKQPHLIDGHPLVVKRAMTNKMLAQPNAFMQTNRVFVGELTEDAGEVELRMFFAQYGNIINVMVVIDKVTTRSCNFGFVTFDNEDAVEKCLVYQHEHVLFGRNIEVHKVPPLMLHMGGAAHLGGATCCVCSGSLIWGESNLQAGAGGSTLIVVQAGPGNHCVCGRDPELGAGWGMPVGVAIADFGVNHFHQPPPPYGLHCQRAAPPAFQVQMADYQNLMRKKHPLLQLNSGEDLPLPSAGYERDLPPYQHLQDGTGRGYQGGRSRHIRRRELCFLQGGPQRMHRGAL